MNVDYTSELQKVKKPTLIFWGDKDLFCPKADQDALNKAIANSQLVIYSGIGHAIHWEAPKKFADDLNAFISLSENGAFKP